VLSLQLRAGTAITAAIAAAATLAVPNLSASAATTARIQKGVLPRPHASIPPTADAPATPVPTREYGVIGFTATARSTTPVEDARAEPARVSREASRTAPAATGWAALNRAIAAIPGYRPGVARWHVTSRYGHYGATDLANGNVYISPSVPSKLLFSIAAHEYAHALSMANYGFQWKTARADLAARFGGGPQLAAERAADCMAKALGATWLHYTACTNSRWRAAAATLLAGQRVS
jgi:hypothetical protein